MNGGKAKGVIAELQLMPRSHGATEVARRRSDSARRFHSKLKPPDLFLEQRNSGRPHVVPLLTKNNKDSELGGTSIRSTLLAFRTPCDLRVPVPPWHQLQFRSSQLPFDSVSSSLQTAAATTSRGALSDRCLHPAELPRPAPPRVARLSGVRCRAASVASRIAPGQIHDRDPLPPSK